LIAYEIVRSTVFVDFHHLSIGVLLQNVLISRHQEPASSTGRVANLLTNVRVDQLHHHSNDVSGRPKLTILPCSLQLPQKMFVDVSLNVGLLTDFDCVND